MFALSFQKLVACLDNSSKQLKSINNEKVVFLIVSEDIKNQGITLTIYRCNMRDITKYLKQQRNRACS